MIFSYKPPFWNLSGPSNQFSRDQFHSRNASRPTKSDICLCFVYMFSVFSEDVNSSEVFLSRSLFELVLASACLMGGLRWSGDDNLQFDLFAFAACLQHNA